MQVGDKVYAMSDNGEFDGVCTILAGRDYDDVQVRTVGAEVSNDADWLLVQWEDDGVKQSLVAYNWSFVPAIADAHAEWNA